MILRNLLIVATPYIIKARLPETINVKDPYIIRDPFFKHPYIVRALAKDCYIIRALLPETLNVIVER